MSLLQLNCPRCRKPLVHIPLDGLTLHYRCAEHGCVILRPLVVIVDDDAASDGVSENRSDNFPSIDRDSHVSAANRS